MALYVPPPGNARIRVVSSFAELVATPFADGVNALCWARALPGDFQEVVERLDAREEMISLDEELLNALPLSAAGRVAADILVGDLRLLRDHGLAPTLDCLRAYPRDDEAEIVRTDVYSWHADRAPVEADTYLCTYHGAASEGVRNEEARRQVDVPGTRAQLRAQFGGADDESFAEHLREHCYDLHYAPEPGARPFSFGVGNLWRIAVEYPCCPVPPCLHRAPAQQPGDPARLLLIS